MGSSEKVEVKGATLQIIPVSTIGSKNVTDPLRCEDGLQMFNYRFLLSNSCPNNVMGMDVVSKLGPYLTSTPEGDKVHKYSNPESNLTRHNGQDLLHVCPWKLQHAKVSSDLLTEAASSGFHLLTLDLLAPEALHCTFHVSPGPNETYEQSWFTKMFDTHLYWGEHRCAASVALLMRQISLSDSGVSATRFTFKMQKLQMERFGPICKKVRRSF